jgi:hypothetical protein
MITVAEQLEAQSLFLQMHLEGQPVVGQHPLVFALHPKDPNNLGLQLFDPRPLQPIPKPWLLIR